MVDFFHMVPKSTGKGDSRRRGPRKVGKPEELSPLSESILDDIDLGVVSLDHAGAVVTWNRAMTDFTGLSEKEAARRDFFDLLPSLRGTLVETRIEAARSRRAPRRIGHLPHAFAKGRRGIFDIRFGAYRQGAASPGVVMIWEDVKLRVRLEEKAKQALQHLSSLVDHSGDAILTLSVGGKIRSWNRTAEEMFGYRESEVTGKDFFFLCDEERRADTAILLERTRSEGKVINWMELFLNRRGEPVDVSITTSMIGGGKGRGGIVAIIRDVSRRRRKESHFFQTEKQAALGILAAGLAHEIHNPLASIMMHAQILGRRPEIADDDRSCVERIEEEVGRIAEIVNGLLIFSGASGSQPGLIDIQAAAEKAIQRIGCLPGAGRINIVRSWGEDVAAFWGIETEIQEIFVNLLQNARDALPEGGEIRVTSRHLQPGDALRAGYPTEHPAGLVEVSVDDGGMGITREQQKKIFDPFFTTKPPGKGTGLGLAVVRRLVDNHRGTIAVRSRPGGGTVFTVCFPAAEGGESAAWNATR
jgi:PAS domain S-box-containing protein